MGFQYQHPGPSSETLQPSVSADESVNVQTHERIRSRKRRDWFESTLFWMSRLASIAWLIVVFTAACIVLISWEGYCDQRHGHRLGEDPTGNIPEFPRVIQHFELTADYTFNPLNTTADEKHQVRKNWDALMPVGHGFFSATKNQNQLPTVTVDPENHPAHITAVFHQLHCLYMIMQAYHSGVQATEETEAMAFHLRHCFEYLRLSLVCHGDTALGGRVDDTTAGEAGAQHVCKDWGAVKRFAETHRTNEFRGIIDTD
ncbi:hypothetical protein VDGD_04658 [Verticillium dahliae]|nr:hypothetical protein EV126DRAFT_445618 [Verticillium dahliae]RBQ83659.1 hypothetical protein VDGD_04658 [Verticillium dahliae]